MGSISASTAGAGRTPDSPAGVFSSVLSAVVGIAAQKVERKVVGWTDKLEGIAGGGAGGGDSSGRMVRLADDVLDEVGEGGAPQRAGAEGVKAGLHGRNPVWGAITGAWQSGTPVVRAAIITAAAAAILLLVLSPVLFLVFVLSLLIFAAVHRVGAAKT